MTTLLLGKKFKGEGEEMLCVSDFPLARKGKIRKERERKKKKGRLAVGDHVQQESKRSLLMQSNPTPLSKVNLLGPGSIV